MNNKTYYGLTIKTLSGKKLSGEEFKNELLSATHCTTGDGEKYKISINGDIFPIEISLPCGCIKEIQMAAMFPQEDIKCYHGNYSVKFEQHFVSNS